MRHRLGRIIERDHDPTGPRFPRRAMAISGDIGEDRRPDEQAAPSTARTALPRGAIFARLVRSTRRPAPRWLRADQRPHGRRGSNGSPTAATRPRRIRAVHELVVDRPVHEHAGAGRAHLARVEEQAHRGAPDGLLEVRVGQDHLRRLASELERHGVNAFGRNREDPPPDRPLPVKLILSTSRVLDQRLTGFGADAGHHVDHAGWDAGLGSRARPGAASTAAHLPPASPRRCCRSRWRRDLPRGDHQGRVPRHDRGDHAHRHVIDVGVRRAT